MRLVLLETSGNQNYVYASNRLIEAVGGSELIYRAGTQFVLEALADLGGPTGLWDTSPEQLKANLQDPNKNSPLESSTLSYEVINAASGKALVLATDEQAARKLVTAVSRRVLCQAPGLHMTGAITDEFDLASDDFGTVSNELHRSGIGVAKQLSPNTNVARFPQLPIAAECASFPQPAHAFFQRANSEPAKPRSLQAIARAQVGATDALGRYGRHGDARFQAITDDQDLPRCARDHDELEQILDAKWIAVIHADTNNAGRLFTDAPEALRTLGRWPNEANQAQRNRAMVTGLRDLSLALDAATLSALNEALGVLAEPIKKSKRKNKVLPAIPLIVGGDDFTGIVAGRHGLDFAAAYLREFERATAESDEIPAMTASVGVAVTGTHFPFTSAYDLAEELTDNCKRLLRAEAITDRSAIDFHVLYDSTASSLDELNDRLSANYPRTANGSTVTLRGGPYLVYHGESDQPNGRSFDELMDRARLLKRRDEEGRYVIPRSQTHDLRDALIAGDGPANRCFTRMQRRYPTAKRLAMDGGNLFSDEQTVSATDQTATATSAPQRTDLLDVMSAAELVEA